jgi:hypothetical protein
MRNETLDKLVWAFIYAGLFGLGLGIWLLEHRPGVGWSLALGGGALVGLGALLIWIRSRRV